MRSRTSEATPPTLSRHLSAKHALQLRNVYVWLDEGMIVTPGGALIAETLPSHYRFVKMLRAGAYDNAPPVSEDVERIDRCTGLKGGRYFGNYYHWWIDEIPRLQALCRLEPPPVVTIPSTYPEQLVGLIQNLIPKSVKTRLADHRNEWVHARRFLYLPPVTEDYCGYMPDGFLRNLRENVVNEVAPNRRGAPDRRYYVSRASSQKRRVLNEQEVVRCLKQYGFDAIQAGEFSFKEQVRRFGRAEWIVGAHGAGLTNMIFSPSCSVVELFPGAPFTHYRWLSESLGHDYHNIVGDPEVGKHADFKVNISALRRILDASL